MSLATTAKHAESGNIVIEVYGLGYVGFPLAVRLASAGLRVIGIDTNPDRLARLKDQVLLASEETLRGEFESSGICLESGPKITDMPKISIICVPTPIPSASTRSDMHVQSAVSSALSQAKKGDAIILESSIEVGTTERIAHMIKAEGFVVGENIGLSFCPERIDPTNKEWGISNIPRIIWCSDDQTYDIAKYIYGHVNGAKLVKVSSPKVAEVTKSFENAFRLVNISLSNELALLCDSLGISSREVIDAAATKPFAFLPHYPGAGAGGHCIPKDPKFLVESAKRNLQEFSTIENALKTNKNMPEYIAKRVSKTVSEMNLPKTAVICGLTYKQDVDDMRDSPGFKVATSLKMQGFRVWGYDPYFDPNSEEKYLVENGVDELAFERKSELDGLDGISCLVLVQHHGKTAGRISEIHRCSEVPLIYDCQHRLERTESSKTRLEYLG